MKLTIKHLHYQRNGVAGQPFYHCLAELQDGGKYKMLITFMTADDDTIVIISSVRAVNVEDLSLSYRGDEIGYQLNKEFLKLMAINGGTIYDCCTKSKLYVSHK